MEKFQEKIEKLLNRRWLTIFVILVLALSLRAIRPLMVDRITSDGPLYVYMATDIADGDMDSAFKRNRRMPPLYLYMMVGLHKLGFTLENAGRLISILAGALLIIPVYLIAEMIFSSRLGAMAAFLVAVNPDLVRNSAKVMRDSLFLLLLFAAMYFLMKALKEGKWNLHCWALGGLFAALGVAVRTETVELTGIALFCIIIELIFFKRDKKPVLPAFGKWAVGWLFFILVYFLAALPISKSIEGTPCTWTILDKRIPAYFNMLFSNSEKEVLDEEDTI